MICASHSSSGGVGGGTAGHAKAQARPQARIGRTAGLHQGLLCENVFSPARIKAIQARPLAHRLRVSSHAPVKASTTTRRAPLKATVLSRPFGSRKMFATITSRKFAAAPMVAPFALRTATAIQVRDFGVRKFDVFFRTDNIVS